MPRRNQRDAPTPLDVAQVKGELAAATPKRRWLSPEEWEARQQQRDTERREREAKRRADRIAAALRWDICCIPGCGEELAPESWMIDLEPSHPDERLPLCTRHEAVVWRQVQRRQGDESTILTVAQLRSEQAARLAERDARDKADRMADTNGWIYYVRLNGLVKVGWTRDLPQRLKSYGASVEVLCHYLATRDDETTLHRQLTPYRAKGREWYTDCPLIADLVAKAIEQHGKPYIKATWTEPKDIIAKRR